MCCNVHQELQSKRQKKQLEEKILRKKDNRDGKRQEAKTTINPGTIGKSEIKCNAESVLFSCFSIIKNRTDVFNLPSFTEKVKQHIYNIMKNEKKKPIFDSFTNWGGGYMARTLGLSMQQLNWGYQCITEIPA